MIYYDISFSGMTKVMTVRMTNMFINQTQFMYIIKVEENITTLRPGQCLSFSLEDQQKNIQIKRQIDKVFSIP